MIEVKNLCKVFTRTIRDKKKKMFKFKNREEEFFAVDNVTFRAKEGEIVGILGPNGAGKTTLLRMLAGILTPTSGSIKICGYDYSEDRNAAKSEIGYLSGNTRLYGRFSPRETLKIFGKLYGMEDDEIKSRIENIAIIMGLEDFMDNRIENLSTGQTQRTSIARCLIHSPKVYIFDEPTLGLDILSSRAIIDFMLAEKEVGKTILYSTHYMKEAETLCDRIILVYGGKIIAQGKPDELMKETESRSLREVFIKLAEKEVGLNED